MAVIPKISETSMEKSLTGRRDAFHVPGILCRSEEVVYPGSSVVFDDEGLTTVSLIGELEYCHAVVDPFIGEHLSPGKLFWVFLKPGTTKDLTHKFEVDLSGIEAEPSDDGCAGCYGDDEEEESGCKGCYE